MKGYLLSPAAQSDLEEIWDYTVERWNPDQAERYLWMIRDACEELAEGKRFSTAIDHIRAGYSQSLVGSHILFFRRTDTGMIDIIRILHQRMDVLRHL